MYKPELKNTLLLKKYKPSSEASVNHNLFAVITIRNVDHNNKYNNNEKKLKHCKCYQNRVHRDIK